jgi:DNA-binding response OmpR family regulator
VPALHSPSARTGSQRSILLLEEYDALAAAISSALKKFAPKHKTSVAQSLAEAENLAAEIRPELFVIDADPPWSGITEFLWNMRTAHPTARVLVIGAGIPPEIANERGSFGALQFINKPFELAAFGAAVQAVLGPWRESGSAVPRGSLSVLKPIDILLLNCAAGVTAMVDIQAGAKRSGKIHIAEGQISHAEAGRLTGADALGEILTWTKARVSEAKSLISPRRTIHRDWVTIFVEALRESKMAEPIAIAPTEKARPGKTRTKTGKKIVVIDDTEMLLIFVADVLATADPELQITTALSGTEGIGQIEQIIPDLVLLDYSLPDLNGDEVCGRLLENERTAHVPVLMMSGHVAAMTAAAAQLVNVVATIEKPFLSDALVQLVQETLAGRRPAFKPEVQASPPVEPAPVEPAPVEPAPAKPAPVKPAPAKPAPVKPAPAKPAPAKPAPAKPAAAKPAAAAATVETRREVREPLPVQPYPAASSVLAPEEFAISRSQRPAPTPPMTIPVAATGSSDTVLGLFLEVLAMQLTPQLQMGAIRAKPASLIASLHLPSSAVRKALPAEMGFQLGAAELDSRGRIATVRIVPTAKPFQPAQTRNAFQIGGVSVVPNETRARVQLTPAGTTPMTMELLAHLELAAAELSPTFQVARLILKWRTNLVHVTLDPKASGARFEIAAVKLDQSGRIAELLLRPAK